MRGALAALVVLMSCACGVLPGSAPAATATPAAAPATTAPSPGVAAASPVASPSPAAVPKPANTAAPSANANTVYVGNTDGEGVYLRKTPNMDDKLDAYPDGTALTVVGDDVDNGGQMWRHVKTPDGTEGYVPAMYTTASPG
jgi:SH3 domain-containing protein